MKPRRWVALRSISQRWVIAIGFVAACGDPMSAVLADELSPAIFPGLGPPLAGSTLGNCRAAGELAQPNVLPGVILWDEYRSPRTALRQDEALSRGGVSAFAGVAKPENSLPPLFASIDMNGPRRP